MIYFYGIWYLFIKRYLRIYLIEVLLGNIMIKFSVFFCFCKVFVYMVVVFNSYINLIFEGISRFRCYGIYYNCNFI